MLFKLLKSLPQALRLFVVLACFQMCATAQSLPGKTSHELVREAAKLKKRDLKKLELHSDAGDMRSQLLLGLAYQHGFGSQHNPRLAAMWISKAALAGEPIAQALLGRFYMEGLGVTQNQEEAVIWFRRAADQGSVEGQFELAEAYERASGVPLDKAQANTLYQMAADNGFAPAKCALNAYTRRYGNSGADVKPPRVLRAPDPEYSEPARRSKFNGTVELWLEIGENGMVRETCVRRPLGFGLEEKAVEAVRRWTFEPASKNGHRIPFAVNVSINFKLY